jgi:orotate phosphoribosyltransferase
MEDNETFIKWLAENTVTKALEGHLFILASGKTSEYYLNLKSVLMHWRFVSQISVNLRAAIQQGNYQYVSGMETAAIPLVALAVAADYCSHELHGFYLRKNKNDHGAKRQIEFTGSLRDKRVLVLEDVVTSGKSSMDAVNILRDAGAYVDEVLCIVDREEGGHELFANEGVKLTSIYTGKQLLREI